MTKQEKIWQKFKGEKIPSSLELFPVIFKYIDKNSKILDVGCGFGKTCVDLFKRKYGHLYGIDINRSGIEFARKKLAEAGMVDPGDHFKVSTARNLPFADAQFDCVITQAFWSTIMPDERKAIIEEISRVMKKQGGLYIAVFGQTWESPVYRERYEDGIKKGYERGTLEAVDSATGKVHYLAHHYTKEEMEKLLEHANLKTEYYSKETFTTQNGNKVNGHVIIAKKAGLN